MGSQSAIRNPHPQSALRNPVPVKSTMPYLNSLLISYEKLGKINKFIKVMLCVSLICLNIIHKEK
jgi:hypothetical protein